MSQRMSQWPTKTTHDDNTPNRAERVKSVVPTDGHQHPHTGTDVMWCIPPRHTTGRQKYTARGAPHDKTHDHGTSWKQTGHQKGRVHRGKLRKRYDRRTHTDRDRDRERDRERQRTGFAILPLESFHLRGQRSHHFTRTYRLQRPHALFCSFPQHTARRHPEWRQWSSNGSLPPSQAARVELPLPPATQATKKGGRRAKRQPPTPTRHVCNTSDHDACNHAQIASFTQHDDLGH